MDELGISYSINSEKDGLRTEQDLAWKKITGTDKLNKEWELAVGQASKAKLWALNLLEGFSFDASPSLLAQFMELAQKAAKVDKNWLLSSAKKSQQLAPLLGKLLASLAKLSETSTTPWCASSKRKRGAPRTRAAFSTRCAASHTCSRTRFFGDG